MHPRTLRQAIEREPFLPIRLHLASGKTIRVPDARAVWRLAYGLLLFRSYRPGRARVSGYDVIDYRLIQRIDPLEARPRKGKSRRAT